MKTGDSVLYREDGGSCECTLLEYSNVNGEESAKLRIEKVIDQPRIGGEYAVGEVFNVWHRTDMGGWGGDWHLMQTHYQPAEAGSPRETEPALTAETDYDFHGNPPNGPAAGSGETKEKCPICNGPISPCGHSEMYGYTTKDGDGCWKCDELGANNAERK